MSGAISSHGGLTRRSFLKATGAAAGAVAVAGAATPTLQALAADSAATAEDEEKLAHTGCMYSSCHQCIGEVVVRDGYAVEQRTWAENPWAERPCAKGRTWIQRTYGEHRLRYPMRRVEGTPRGGGQWERISWEEAISQIADQVKKTTAEYGPHSVAGVLAGQGGQGLLHGTQNGNLLTRLFNVMEWTTIIPTPDDAVAFGHQKVWGDYMYHVPQGMPPTATATVANVVWGLNTGVTFPNRVTNLLTGKQKGTKLVVVDPNYTFIASKADMWVRPRPGTDPALMMSLMQVIIEENLHDADFLLKNTVAPVLIRQDNGRYLRESDITGAPRPASDDESARGGSWQSDPVTCREPCAGLLNDDEDPCQVWDGDANGPVSLYECANPLMSGTFEVNGIACKTAFDMLVERVAPFVPEEATKICEVDPETIREFARLCAKRYVAHDYGYGPQAFCNGAQVGTGLATLMCLTGNVGTKIGDVLWGNINGEFFYPTETSSPKIPLPCFFDTMDTGKWNGQDWPVKVLLLPGSGSSVGGGVDLNRTKSGILDKMDLIVSVDITLNEGPAYSDIVLPAATILEKSDLLLIDGYCVKYQDKSIDPLYECKPDGEFVRLLADAVGAGAYFKPTDDEFMEMALDTDRYHAEGVTLERCKAENLISLKGPYVVPKTYSFRTKTKKAEFYLDYPVCKYDAGYEYDFDEEHLICYYEPYVASPENPQMAEYPFVLLGHRTYEMYHTQYWDVNWLRETLPEPTVDINPEDARARGLEDGQYVEVFNHQGHAVAKLVYSAGVRPGVLSYAVGWRSADFKAGNWVELLTSKYDPLSQTSSYSDAIADIRAWEED